MLLADVDVGAMRGINQHKSPPRRKVLPTVGPCKVGRRSLALLWPPIQKSWTPPFRQQKQSFRFPIAIFFFFRAWAGAEKVTYTDTLVLLPLVRCDKSSEYCAVPTPAMPIVRIMNVIAFIDHTSLLNGMIASD